MIDPADESQARLREVAPRNRRDRPRRRTEAPRWLRVTALMMGQSTQNVSLGAVALVLPLIREDIAMTFAEAGALSVATTLTYALGQLPAGLLGNRFGAQRVMVVGLVGLNAATALIALVPGYAALLVVLVVIGALRALVFPPGLTLITSEFSAARRATAMSLFMAAGFTATLLVSLAAPPLIGPLGWRGLFAFFGIVGMITAATYVAVLRLSPDRIASTAVRRRPRTRLGPLIREPVLWLANTVQFTRLAVTISLRFWLPTYLVLDKGFSVAAAAVVFAVGSAISILATLLGGHLSDRRQQPVRVIMISLSALTVGLIALTLVQGFTAVLIVVTLLFTFVQAYSGSLFEIPLRVLGEGNASVVNGVGNLWANIGGLVMSLALGVTRDLTGSFDGGWLAVAGLGVVALAAALGLRRLLDLRGPLGTLASR